MGNGRLLVYAGLQTLAGLPHCPLCFGALPIQTRDCSHSPGLFSASFTTFQLSPLPELLGNDQELSRTRLEYLIAWLTTAPTSSCSQPWSQSDLPISNPNCPLRLTLPHLLFQPQGIISIHLHSASKKASGFIVSPLSHNNPYFGSGKTL